MKYRFLEDIATADVAFEAYGKTLAELFKNCALALTEVMVDTKTIKPVLSIKYKVLSIKIEELLFDFLSELVFLKDSKQLLFSKFDIKIHYDTAQYHSKRYRLKVVAQGEKIDPARHKLRIDVKAVTWHLFRIEKTEEGYKARVIVDI